jgi:hypothetical protein
VARNVAGKEAVEEGDQAAAETWALGALDLAFKTLDLELRGSVFGVETNSAPLEYGEYTLVQEVKDISLPV